VTPDHRDLLDLRGRRDLQVGQVRPAQQDHRVRPAQQDAQV
jgi:hypothetical protein